MSHVGLLAWYSQIGVHLVCGTNPTLNCITQWSHTIPSLLNCAVPASNSWWDVALPQWVLILNESKYAIWCANCTFWTDRLVKSILRSVMKHQAAPQSESEGIRNISSKDEDNANWHTRQIWKFYRNISTLFSYTVTVHTKGWLIPTFLLPLLICSLKYRAD